MHALFGLPHANGQAVIPDFWCHRDIERLRNQQAQQFSDLLQRYRPIVQVSSGSTILSLQYLLYFRL